MQYSYISAAFLALASTVVAQTTGFDAITVPSVVKAGTTVTVTWTNPAVYDNETVSITLLQGPSQPALQRGELIASGVDNGAHSYEWVVKTSIPQNALYGLLFETTRDTSIFQYSNPFTITGLSSSSASYSVSGSATASGATTTTVHISINPTYSSKAINSTSVATSTSVSSSGNASVVTFTSTASPKPTNGTLATTATIKTTTGTSSSSAIATQTKNAAIANVAKGSFAVLGGFALAFAL